MIEIDKDKIEEFGAEVGFNHSGDVIFGHCTTILDDGTLVIDVEDEDLSRFHNGTHYVAPADVEEIEYKS